MMDDDRLTFYEQRACRRALLRVLPLQLPVAAVPPHAGMRHHPFAVSSSSVRAAAPSPAEGRPRPGTAPTAPSRPHATAVSSTSTPDNGESLSPRVSPRGLLPQPPKFDKHAASEVVRGYIVEQYGRVLLPEKTPKSLYGTRREPRWVECRISPDSLLTVPRHGRRQFSLHHHKRVDRPPGDYWPAAAPSATESVTSRPLTARADRGGAHVKDSDEEKSQPRSHYMAACFEDPRVGPALEARGVPVSTYSRPSRPSPPRSLPPPSDTPRRSATKTSSFSAPGSGAATN